MFKDQINTIKFKTSRGMLFPVLHMKLSLEYQQHIIWNPLQWIKHTSLFESLTYLRHLINITCFTLQTNQYYFPSSCIQPSTSQDQWYTIVISTTILYTCLTNQKVFTCKLGLLGLLITILSSGNHHVLFHTQNNSSALFH